MFQVPRANETLTISS